MARQHHTENVRNSNNTAETTLVALTIQICGFVHEGALDSRCAARLVKRLRKEAEAISETLRITKSGRKELIDAFDAVDAVLRTHDAALLVAANAALRTTAETTGTMQST